MPMPAEPDNAEVLGANWLLWERRARLQRPRRYRLDTTRGKTEQDSHQRESLRPGERLKTRR